MSAMRLSMLTVLAACVAARPAALAQDKPTVINSYLFAFDFSVAPTDLATIDEVQLYYSTDQGKTWKLYRGVPPRQGSIPFEAALDGEYWFAVQQIYKDGKKRPPSMANATPQRKVVVDTMPPRINLTPAPVGKRLGVEWNVLADDADLNSMRLRYRRAGSLEWQPVAISPTRSGRQEWDAPTTGAYEVQLRLFDQAKNESTPTVTVSSGGGFGSASNSVGRSGGDDGNFWEPSPPTGGRANESAVSPSNARGGGLRSGGRLVNQNDAPTDARPDAAAPERLSNAPAFYVNKLRFNINYKLENLGKSGVKQVLLYWRHEDESEWQEYGPNATTEPPFRVAVDGEGKYGIHLRAVSGVGLGDEPPRSGAAPQLWVVVDVTPPVVELLQPEVRHGAQPEVMLAWRATDAHPSQKKVKLSYAAVEGPDAKKWVEIVAGQPNEGRYRWKVPNSAPYLFHVRVEAEDAAGNAAQDATREPVAVDNAKPRALAVNATASDDGSAPKSDGVRPPPAGPVPKAASVSVDDDEPPPAAKPAGGKRAPDLGAPPPPLPN